MKSIKLLGLAASISLFSEVAISKEVDIEILGKKAYQQCVVATTKSRRQCESGCGNIEAVCYELQREVIKKRTATIASTLPENCALAYEKLSQSIDAIDQIAQETRYLANSWSYFDIAIQLELVRHQYASSLRHECPPNK